MNTFIIIFLSLLAFSFCISYLAVKKQLKNTQDLLLETFEANYILTEQLTSGDKNEDIIHKENFIKYLSDSREWAFSYIENTQTTIKEISEEINKKGFPEISNKLNLLLPERLDK